MAVIDATSLQRFVLIPGAVSLLLFAATALFLHRRFPRSAGGGDADWLNRAWLLLWEIVLWLSILQTCVIASLFMHQVELRRTGGMWLLGLIGVWNIYYSFAECADYLAAIRGHEE